MKTVLLAILSLGWAGAVAPIQAQTDPSFWVQTQGPEGGLIAGMARLSDGELIACATTSGLFRSRDGGRTWSLANGNIAADYGSGALWMGGVAVDDQDRAFMLAGWALFRGERLSGEWHWKVLWDGPNGPGAIAFLPLAGGQRTLAVDSLGAVWRSDDHGETWASSLLPVEGAPESGRGLAVAADGSVWAVTRQAAYRSLDGGLSWTLQVRAADFEGPPWGWSPVTEFGGSIGASPDGEIYLGFDFMDGTLRVDPDGTATVLPTWEVAYYPTTFAFGPGGRIYAGTYQNSGVIWSADRGQHWQRLGTWNGSEGLASHSVWSILLLPDDTLLAGAAGDGVLRCATAEAAPAWIPSKAGMIGSDVNAIAVDRQGTLYVAASGAGLFRSDDTGATWIPLAPERWVSDTMPMRGLVVNSQGHVLGTGYPLAVSTDRGLSWQNRPLAQSDPPVGTDTPQGNCLVIDRNDRVVVGSWSGIHITADAGLTWQPGSLTMPVYSLALGADQRTLLATTWGEGPGHGLYLSNDAGLNWTSIPFFAGRHVLGAAVDADGTLFAGPNSPSFPGENNPGFWRSRDGGANWEKLRGFDNWAYAMDAAASMGFPQLLFNADRVLYVAAGGGTVIRTADQGDTWQRVSTGMDELPTRSVLCMTFDTEGYCLLGTWGAGVFRSRESTAPYQRVQVNLGAHPVPVRVVTHSSGLLKLVLEGSADFDTTTIDPATVTFGGAPVHSNGAGKWMLTLRDDNRDGYGDIVLTFSIPRLQLEPGVTEAMLSGRTTTGRAFRAMVPIQQVP